MLRGVGAAMALPFLDSMIPALTAQRIAMPAVRRMGIFFVPNGFYMDKWTPATEGPGFVFNDIMKSMEPFRDKLLAFSGIDSEPSVGMGGAHTRACSTWLTGVEPVKSGVKLGISADQVAANAFKDSTQFSSLQLTMEVMESTGLCENGFSCAYPSTVSWANPTTPLPPLADPRSLFERIFGDGERTDAASRSARNNEERLVMDAVMEQIADLRKDLGNSDRYKLEEYTDSIRDVERRIQIAEKQMGRTELPSMQRPAGTPDNYPEHFRLLTDLLILALQADLTRVWTFQFAKEESNMTYAHIGVNDSHHELSHHAGHQDKIEEYIKINIHHAELFSEFLGKLNKVSEGGVPLLDRSAVLFGSGMSDANRHNMHNLPLVLAGGGEMGIKGGSHLRCTAGTPITNLLVTMLDKVGVPTEKLGNSTGTLDRISMG
jgi:hypothetical protein